MRAEEDKEDVVALQEDVKEINTVDDLTITEVQESVITHLAVMTSGIGDDRLQGTYLFNMLRYCFGWGIVDVPPDEHELYSIFNAYTIRDKRAVWVQHVICKDITEARTLMADIMNYEKHVEAK